MATDKKMQASKEYELEEQLNLHTTVPFWTGNDTYKGYVLCKGFKRLQDSIENFEVYDDDVWVTSFPKCGTTWMQYLVWCIKNRLNLSREESLDGAYAFLELSCLYLPDGPEVPPLMQASVERAALKPRPRLIKTHLPWDLLPRQIRSFNRRPKIIHVTRDIRDACVSYFYHHRLLHGFTGSFELFCKLFVANKLMYCPPVPTILGYYNLRSEPNILFVKYEDMKSNLESVLIKVADFLEVEISDKDIENILPRLSFKAMKENRLVNKEHATKTFKESKNCSKKIVEDLDFIRKGQCGDHKFEMTNDMIEIIDKDIMLPLKNAGLTF